MLSESELSFCMRAGPAVAGSAVSLKTAQARAGARVTWPLQDALC